jgi:hypothetical protein
MSRDGAYDPSDSSGLSFWKGANWWYATPLLAAPLIPTARIALRNHPRLQRGVFFAMVGGFLIHGFLLYGTADSKRGGGI